MAGVSGTETFLDASKPDPRGFCASEVVVEVWEEGRFVLQLWKTVSGFINTSLCVLSYWLGTDAVQYMQSFCSFGLGFQDIWVAPFLKNRQSSSFRNIGCKHNYEGLIIERFSVTKKKYNYLKGRFNVECESFSLWLRCTIILEVEGKAKWLCISLWSKHEAKIRCMCISMLLSGTTVYSMELTETGHEGEDFICIDGSFKIVGKSITSGIGR